MNRNTENIAESLADQIRLYTRGRRDKKEEEFLKTKPKKNKQGEVTNGAINYRLIALAKDNGVDSDEISAIEKLKKTQEETPLEFQKTKYERLLSLIDENVVSPDTLDIKNEYQNFLQTSADEHDAIPWLTVWSEKAKDISFATHVGKLTHSSSKSSSILDVTKEKNDCYLTTSSLARAEIDTASSNAASLPIADILKLEADGVSVLDCLKSGDKNLFNKLTDDEKLVDEWCENLKQAYDSSDKQSYFLSKQSYFPVGSHQYHLLLPLTSSSLVQALHLEHKQYWDEDQENARKLKSEKRYSATTTRTYPNKAHLRVTQSNHSNASSLNGKRGGRITLLPSMPPQWLSNFQFNPNKTSVFDKALSIVLRPEIDEMNKYLLLVKNKSLRISEPKRNAAVIKKLKDISGRFLDYIVQVNSSTNSDGWTLDSGMPIEQQLLFEPWRTDDTAMQAKAGKQWQKTLSKSYGNWLSKQLAQKNKLAFTPIHDALWADVFLVELREFIAVQEVSV